MSVLNWFTGISRELKIRSKIPGYGYFSIKLVRIALSEMFLFRL